MSEFEMNLEKCKSIMEATKTTDGTKLKNGLSVLIYKDTECDVLVIKGDGCCIGLMNHPQWIRCYEFDSTGEFNSFEPMTREDLAWALSPNVTVCSENIEK